MGGARTHRPDGPARVILALFALGGLLVLLIIARLRKP